MSERQFDLASVMKELTGEFVGVTELFAFHRKGLMPYSITSTPSVSP